MARVAIEIRDSTNSVVGTLDVGSDLSFPLSITKSIASLNDMGKRGGSYTKTFKIPATKENNKLLVNLYSASQRNVKKMKFRKEALILVDGVLRARGYIKVLSALVGKRPEKYTLRFFGDNIDWVTQVAELNLDDITFNNDSQAYTTANIEASWTGTYSGGNDHVYPWINYGQYIHATTVSVEDLRIAIRLRAIVERTLNKIGYRLSSVFMNTTKFKQLIFPIVSNTFVKTATQVTAQGARATQTTDFTTGGTLTLVSLNFNDDSTGDNYDNASAWNGVNKYTTKQAGYFRLKFKIKLVPTSNSNSTNVVRVRLETSPPNNIITIVDASDTFIETDGFDQEFTSPYMRLQNNTDIRVYLKGNSFDPQMVLKADSWVKIEMSNLLVRNNAFNISDILPETPVMDLFNDLTKMFNLYWVSDPKTKIVAVEPRDTFYKNISDSLNWSSKLDVSATPKLMFITDAYKRKLLFRYAEDSSDGYVLNRNKIKNDLFASYRHDLPDRFTSGQQVFKTSVVAPTYWIKDNNASPTNDFESPVTARLWNEPLPDDSPPKAVFDYAPRILNFNNATQLGDDDQALKFRWGRPTVFGDSGSGFTTLTTIPYALMHPVFDGNVSAAYNLSFAQSDGLFATYYGKSIKLIEDGIRLEASFYLKASDFATDMRTPIYLSSPDELQGYWIIDTIHDWSPVRDRSTKVTLIKLINYEPVPIDATQIPIEPIEPIDIKADLSDGGGTTEEDDPDDFNSPSLRLSNGTGNQALKGGGALAFGQGCVAYKKNQNIMGAYPVIDDSKFAIGVGTSKDDRITAFRSDVNGNVTMYGGGIYMINDNGERVQVTMESGNKIRNVYLK